MVASQRRLRRDRMANAMAIVIGQRSSSSRTHESHTRPPPVPRQRDAINRGPPAHTDLCRRKRQRRLWR
jgi:hypothetical protein